jgi:retinol dehydrogenase-12
MADWYPTSKRQFSPSTTKFCLFKIHSVLNVLFTRSLAAHLPATLPLIVDCVNPGLCHSDLQRNTPLLLRPMFKLLNMSLARKTADGAKTFVWAALAGKGQKNTALRQSLQGAFTMGCAIREPSDYAMSKEGQNTESRLWVSNF